MIIKEEAMTGDIRVFLWENFRTHYPAAVKRCVTATEGGELVGVLGYRPDGELYYCMRVDEAAMSKEEKQARIDWRILHILDAVFGTGLPAISATVKRGNRRARRVFSYFFPPPEPADDVWFFKMRREQWAKTRHNYMGNQDGN